MASTIALTSGSASASPVFGYSGYSYGTDVESGLANSGPQVISKFGCTTDANKADKNDIAAANVNGQAIARTVKTDTHGFDNASGTGVTSTATAADVKVGTLLTLTGVKTTTTSKYSKGQLSYTGSTTFAGVRIGAISVPSLINPKPNTKVAIPGLGYIVLNRVGGVKTASGIYSYAQAVVIHATVKNQFIPQGVDVAVLKTRAEISKPATALVIGSAYGTKATADKLVVSDATSLQTTCQGTEGKTVRVAVGELNIPKVAYVGGVYTTKNGAIGANKSYINFTSHVAGVKVGNLSIGAIESSASAWKTKDNKAGVSSSSTIASIKVGGKTYAVPTGENKTLNIPGIAKLTFNQVMRQKRYIEVNALVIDVYSLNTKVVVAHSAAGVVS
ncbi:choice-of-anchor P family protein [Kribbella sp.]|uniref:choice-of-anchor P family protein n=1 Tax=Kribbella sp. TaxID=1871183 RepID=UPI002D73AB09|nr:choice-of-anchor P family protein [Kribbella sp.]HZX05099.1 choice-of-anchor P family protein [Kribbella sp.]